MYVCCDTFVYYSYTLQNVPNIYVVDKIVHNIYKSNRENRQILNLWKQIDMVKKIIDFHLRRRQKDVLLVLKSGDR